MTSSTIRILGIDPGLNHTGFGVIDACGDRLSFVTAGCIHVPERELADRLAFIFRELAKIIEETKPAVASAEIIFLNINPKSTLKLGQARGAALTCAAVHDLNVAEYTPSEIKNTVVGTGRATKEQVQDMVKRILGLTGDIQADAADALAAAITRAHSEKLAVLNTQKGTSTPCSTRSARRSTSSKRSAWEQFANSNTKRSKAS